MGSSIYGNFGIRRLVDQFQRYTRAGLPASYRIKNFVDNPIVSDMGFQFVPSASGTIQPTGTTDIPIVPQPSIALMNMQALAFAQSSGSKLLVGARTIVMSHTWVEAQMTASWYLDACAGTTFNSADPETIWKLPCVVGIVTDNLLLEIVDITHEDAYGGIMNWFLTANASELSFA